MFPTCQRNVAHKTAFLPPFHVLYGSEAHSQHCAIVGRRRAVRSVEWWGDLCVARCLCAHRAWHLQIQGRPFVPTLLCGTTKAPCGLNMYSAAHSPLYPSAKKQAMGRACFTSGIHSTHHNHYISPQLYYFFPNCASFNSSKNSGQEKAKFRLTNKYSSFYTFYILCSEDFPLISCKSLLQ